VKLKQGLTTDRRDLRALRELLGVEIELPLETPEINCTSIVWASQPTLPVAGLRVVNESKGY